MEEVVGQLLTEKRLKLAVAESCTGGLIGHRMTNVAGSSKYFEGEFVTYSNELKMSVLGVQRGDARKSHGAVSEECVLEMAAGAMRTGGRRRCDCDFGRGGTGRRQRRNIRWARYVSGWLAKGCAPRAAIQIRGTREWIKTAAPGRWRSIGCGAMRWGCRSEVRRRFSGDRGRGKNRESFNLCETLEFKLFCAPRRLVSSARKLAWCEGFTLPTVKISSGPYERRGCDLPAFVKHGLRDQKEDV